MEEVLIIIVGSLFYVSGFLVWPMCHFLWRKQKRPTKTLRLVFFAELICQSILVGFLLFSRGLMEHQYGWLFLIILVNVIFTPVALIASARDYALSEAAASSSEQPPNEAS